MKNIINKIFNRKNNNKPVEPAILTLCLQDTADSEIRRVQVDEGYLNWFVVNGKDLDFHKCWVE